jgi:regulator of RNase E activity RraA
MTDERQCPLGLRIYRRIRRPPAASLARLTHAGVGDVCDAMRGLNVMDPGISAAYQPCGRIFGPAITVDLAPGDGMMLRAALELAQPGDVIIANAHGVTARAILGGSVGMQMVHRGVAGLVVDGAVRDIGEFRAVGLPVMARAVTARSGTTGAGWGEVNVPVACGGVVVHPGDLVIGDEEGLVVVPRRWLDSVADTLGKTNHTPYDPASIRARLAALPADAPVTGIARVRKAMAEQGGLELEGPYGEDDGPG